MSDISDSRHLCIFCLKWVYFLVNRMCAQLQSAYADTDSMF